MNPEFRILKSYYQGNKFRWLLQVRESTTLGYWYRTIDKTRFVWRVNRWKKKYGAQEI